MIQNSPRTVENERLCTTTDTQAGEDIDRVSGNRQSLAGGDIFAGIYIANQARFKFSCSGCISSIQLAVTTSSQLKDNEGNETIHFHLFTSRTDDNLIVQRKKTFTWDSSVLMNGSDRLLVEYRPLNGSEVCFTQGDKFGFTIDAGLEVALKSRVTSSTADFVLNVSSQLPTSGCPQLNESGLYQFDTSTNSLMSPLVHVEIGKSVHYNYLYHSLCHEINVLSLSHAICSSHDIIGPPSIEVMTTEPPTQADTASPSVSTDHQSSTSSTLPNSILMAPSEERNFVAVVGGAVGGVVIIIIAVLIIVVIVFKKKGQCLQN